jgi:hypothetical protein
MASPSQMGVKLIVNLLTMPYLLFFSAPNFLKSQETNFIDNHLKGCIPADIKGCSVTGSNIAIYALEKS